MIQTKMFRVSALAAITTLVIAVLVPAISIDALSSSSLALSDSRPTTTSTYTFDTSSLSTGTTINCIQLDIGTVVDGTGDAGLDLSSITLDSTTIPSSGSWVVGSVDGATDQMRATLVGGATPNASGNIVWGGVVNGATVDTTYFGLFETYSNVDCTTGGPVDSAVVTFIYKDGALVSLTIDPTLTFTVAGVASSSTVNGDTTTITTTPTAIDFLNSVNSSANGISAHDLTAGTNATGGYSVYIRHTALLTSGADTIDNWTGTNAVPTTFTAAGTEAWGYTTDDGALLSGTTDRFTSGGSKWSGFSIATNELVGDDAGPIASDTTRVGHQVAVDASTDAGTYQTTIVYTAASTY